MRILYLATYNTSCGIATYTDQLRNALSIEHDIIRLPDKSNPEILDDSLQLFIKKAVTYDAVHIQHEHGLFIGSGDESDAIERFGELLKQLNKLNVKTFVTFHSDPVFYTSKIKWTAIDMMRSCLSRMWKKQVAVWFQPKHKTTAIVHTERTRTEFIKSTLHKNNVVVIPHGVLQRKLKPKPIDPNKTINMSIFGFISEYKGYHVALNALQYLPDNYRLICMGGRHPTSDGDEYTQILQRAYDIDRAIVEHDLHLVDHVPVRPRLTITDYLNDKQADHWHGQTHICLAPYIDRTLSGSGALTWSITSGRPTIASNIPSFKTINDEYNCMKLFKVDAHMELAWIIKHVVENKHVQQDMLAGASKYSDELSWSNVGKMHIALYNM